MAINIVGPKTLQALVDETEKRYAKSLTIAKKETADSGYVATYNLIQDGEVVGEPINIPKDYLVKSASVRTASAADTPVTGYMAGDKYIDFVVNTVGGDGNESHIYLLVRDLVTPYTGGNGITIDGNNSIAVVIDSASSNGLSAGANGLSMALATTSAPGAMSAEDKQKLDTTLQASDFREITAAEVEAMFNGS